MLHAQREQEIVDPSINGLSHTPTEDGPLLGRRQPRSA